MTEKLRKINWINVVLFISLAANFFVAGYLVSDVKVFRNLHTLKKVSYRRPDIRIVDYFPKEQRNAFRREMFSQKEKIKPIKDNFLQQQKNILSIISEKDLNEDKLRAAFQNYQNINMTMQDALNSVVIDMLLEMDFETRSDILKRSKRAHERRKVMKDTWVKRFRDRDHPRERRER